MKSPIKILWLLLIGAVLQTAVGQDFQIHQMTFSSGGGLSSSTSMKMVPTLCQIATSTDSSASFRQGYGFWYQYQSLKLFFLYAFQVNDGWNMISVPRTVTDYSAKTLFPTAVSSAFSYQGGYSPMDSLNNGPGYWLKFTGSQFVSFVGAPLTNDSIAVAANWNLIGSISKSIDTSAIVQVPAGIVVSPYFAYNGGYTLSPTIDPGKAYWVRTSGSGKLVLNTSMVNQKATVATVAESTGLNTLSFEKVGNKASSAGQNVQLYFGESSGKELTNISYQLPPVPPKGGFDVRFGTNNFVELFNGTIPQGKEIPIQVQYDGLQVNMKWSMAGKSNMIYSLIERSGSKIITQKKLQSDGQYTLNLANLYSLKVEQIPKKMALYQNYPNPFNPSTTIQFDISQQAIVNLTIYNTIGQQVATLIGNEYMEVGQHSATFNGTNVASGVYFYRFNVKSGSSFSQNYSSVKKMMLVK